MDFLEKVKNIPEPVKSFFESNDPRLISEKVCFLYGVSEKSIPLVTGPSGLIFVGDIRLEDFPEMLARDLHVEKAVAYGIAYEMNRRLHAPFPEYFKNARQLLQQWEPLKANPLISEEEAYQKVLRLEPWIVEEESEKRSVVRNLQAEQDKMDNLFILDALAKYPRLNDQAVTNERIKVKSEKEPVRPTVRNWLRAYRDVLGVRAHTAMERGQFLFGSENTKKLSSEERERLAVIFKSLDENEPLGIDPAKQEIVFPEKPIAAVPSSASSYQEPALEDLPAFARPTVAPNANPASAAPRQASPQPTSPRFNFSHTNPSPAPAIRFSTGHVLPAEKEGSGSGIFDRKPSATPVPSQSPATGRPPQALPVQNRPGNPSESGHTAPSTTSVPHSSFRISPSQSSMGRPAPAPSSAKPREVWQVPQSLGNVVDLRPKE
jgi:hypothetical protein